MPSFQPINLTAATLTLDYRTHGQTVVTVNRAAGSTITLPAASGSGAEFDIFVGTTITSVALVVQVANASDIMSGVVVMATDNASDVVVAFEAGAADDTITMNGTTKGGVKGDRIKLRDIALNVWAVNVVCAGTGTEVTPFSSAV